MDDDWEDWEVNPTFEGTCTCPPNCPNYDEPEKHGWGDCGGELPGDKDCPCEAGWCE
jgi:hypothetical protein